VKRLLTIQFAKEIRVQSGYGKKGLCLIGVRCILNGWFELRARIGDEQ
jgi:hypothetical protein